MKKIKYLLIAIIMFVVPLCVLAKTSIEGTDIIDIKVPETWKTFTKSNLDEMMTWMNFDATKKNNYIYAWNTNSYYFDIINESKTTEIILIKKDSTSEIDDLSIYQDDKIIETFKEVKKTYEGYEAKVTLHTTASGVKYYKIEYKDENLNLNLIDYITNIHGIMYQYKVQSSAEIADATETEIDQIINSIEYENYEEFIENNKITDEPKKKSNGSGAGIIIVFIFLIGIIVAVYFLVIKKKMGNKTNNQPQTYTQVNSNPLNPAVSDFMNPTSSTTTTVPMENQNNSQDNTNNNGQ